MRRISAVVLLALVAGTLGVARGSTHFVKMTDVRVEMDDGVVLTSDIYVPTVADGDGDGLYPCVVELTPYRKENRATEGASYLPGAGIALIEVDARGTGGSGGEYDIVFSVREQADAAAWVDWAAEHATKPDGTKLCEETVGMYGGSYSGIIQYLVASLPDTRQGDVPAAPQHLAAIAPQRAYGDLYRDIVYHGGQLIGSFGAIWSAGTTAYYTQPPMDLNTSAGRAAWVDHVVKNDALIDFYLANPYIDATYTSDDSATPYSQKLYEDSSILPRIENLRVPTLHLAGWFDTFARGQLQTFTEAYRLERTLGDRGPNHLIVGPWNHAGTHFITPDGGFKEHLGQWYRYWLEGGANGEPAPAWMSGDRVRYFDMRSGTVNAQGPADGTWRTATNWPPPELQAERLYLTADGSLSSEEPADPFEAAYVSNPTAGTAEILSRWDNAASGSMPQPQWDQRLESGKGLTFQTPPLTEQLRLAGPIVLRLIAEVYGIGDDRETPDGLEGYGQLMPPYLDTDFVVKLSDVAPDGSARLITQGYLRASHYIEDHSLSHWYDDELLLPIHTHLERYLRPLQMGEHRTYRISVWPTAKTFEPGHSIRLDVYSADTPNHLTLLRPTVNVVREGSYLGIPVVE